MRTKREIVCADDVEIVVDVREYSPPEEPGHIGGSLQNKLITLIAGGIPCMVVDFTPEAQIHLAGISERLRIYAEDVSIFDPIDDERPISLFGDFSKDSRSNLCRLGHVMPLFTNEKYLTFPLETIAPVFSDLLSNADGSVLLSKLLFAYDQKCFDDLMAECKVTSEKIQDARGRLSVWFHHFNERSLSSFYMTNPFFLRLMNAIEFPWNVTFSFIRLDLTKMSIKDAKWMAEAAIIAKTHAVLDSRVLSVPPPRIATKDLEGCDDAIVNIIRRSYTQMGDHFIWSGAGYEGLSYGNLEQIKLHLGADTSFHDLNIFIIDDDIGIIDLAQTLQTALRGRVDQIRGKINVFLQTGTGEEESAEVASKKGVEIADAIRQLSRLKWGRPKSELEWDHKDFMQHIYGKFSPFFDLAFGHKTAPTGLGQAVSHRYLQYTEMDQADEHYPIGIIEALANKITKTD